MKIKIILKFVLELTGAIIFFIALLAVHSANYLLDYWGELDFATVLYQISSPLRGTSEGVISQYLHTALYPTITIFVIVELLWILYTKIFVKLQIGLTVRIGKWNREIVFKTINNSKVRKYAERLICGALVFVMGILVWSKSNAVGIPVYISSITDSSTIFEEEYVSPEMVDINFVEKKNLIFIFLESMETTYMDKASGGQKDSNYIPNLAKMATEYISFSDKDGMGGLFESTGNGWTTGALLGATAGVPFKMPIERSSADLYENFLPGIINIGEVLKKNGYNNYFMCGSDAGFGGRELYFRSHGDYEIFDYNTAQKVDKIIPKDYYEFWGFEDQKLYQYAKEKLEIIAKKDEPFNFTMLTVDSHYPDGYICDLCEDTYSQQYGNALYCSDKQIAEFLAWIQEQSWYEDTVVVITGDHFSMNGEFFADIPREERKIYNCFVNVDLETLNGEKNRQACILDIFPTTLAAVGAEIEGNRLGLGTNLFSDVPTLAEEMGVEEFDNELKKYLKYYDKYFIRKN